MKKWSGIRLFLAVMALVALFPLRHGHASEYTWNTDLHEIDLIGWAGHVKSIAFKAMEEETHNDLKIRVWRYCVYPEHEKVIERFKEDRFRCLGLASHEILLLAPEMAVVQLPFLFNDYGEADFIRHKMAPDFDELFRKRGLVLLLWVHRDFDWVVSTKPGIQNADDFKNRVFAVNYGWIERLFLERMGARIAPISPYRANIDGARDNLFDSMIDYSFSIAGRVVYKKLKTFNPMPVHYSPAVVVVKRKTFEKLPEAYQEAILRNRLPLADRVCEEVLKDNHRVLEALVQQGMIRVETPPGQIEILKERSRPVYEEATGKLFQRELLDELERNLEVYRAVKRD